MKEPEKKKLSHRERRRRALLEAAAEVMKREGIHSFSVQQVADEAGVSHRTLYRYFPTREDLIEALIGHYEECISAEPLKQPEKLDDLPEYIGPLFQRFEAYPNQSTVGAFGALILGRQFSSRAERDRAVFAMVEEEQADESPVTAREAGAIVRYLANATSWIVLRQQLGLSEEEASRAVSWALATVIKELKSSDGSSEDQ